MFSVQLQWLWLLNKNYTYKESPNNEEHLTGHICHVEGVRQQDEEVAYREGDNHGDHGPLWTHSVHEVATDQNRCQGTQVQYRADPTACDEI